MNEFLHSIPHAWTFPALPAALIAATAVLYLRGWSIARKTRPEHLPPLTAVSFLLGLAALWIALASPIDALDDYLLSAHMIQHFLLMSVVPPLLLLGAPAVPLLHGLPRPIITRIFAPVMRRTWFHGLAHAVGNPIFAWLAMNLAYLAWHIPSAFELTLRSAPIHNSEHLCFLLTSILFWWVVISPWPSVSRLPRWAILPYLLTADIVNTMLSAFLTFSGRVLYPTYAAAARITGLTPLGDQAAAGAEMWVLNSFVFLIPAILITVRLLSPKGLSAPPIRANAPAHNS